MAKLILLCVAESVVVGSFLPLLFYVGGAPRKWREVGTIFAITALTRFVMFIPSLLKERATLRLLRDSGSAGEQLNRALDVEQKKIGGMPFFGRLLLIVAVACILGLLFR